MSAEFMARLREEKMKDERSKIFRENYQKNLEKVRITLCFGFHFGGRDKRTETLSLAVRVEFECKTFSHSSLFHETSLRVARNREFLACSFPPIWL